MQTRRSTRPNPLVMAAFFAAAAALLMTSTVYALDEGARAPALRGAILANGSGAIDLASQRGHVVIVDFWASWCEPCGEAMPALEQLYQRYRGHGLRVIGVSVDRTADNARGFLRQARVSFPIMHDADHSAAERFGPPTMPSTYVIDRQGIVRHVHAGFRAGDAAALERVVRELL